MIQKIRRLEEKLQEADASQHNVRNLEQSVESYRNTTLLMQFLPLCYPHLYVLNVKQSVSMHHVSTCKHNSCLLILVPRGCDPLSQHQELRSLTTPNNESP